VAVDHSAPGRVPVGRKKSHRGAKKAKLVIPFGPAKWQISLHMHKYSGIPLFLFIFECVLIDFYRAPHRHFGGARTAQGVAIKLLSRYIGCL
jgi:hypothetical protein